MSQKTTRPRKGRSLAVRAENKPRLATKIIPPPTVDLLASPRAVEAVRRSGKLNVIAILRLPGLGHINVDYSLEFRR
jgi:hypothetical protein